MKTEQFNITKTQKKGRVFKKKARKLYLCDINNLRLGMYVKNPT